MALALPLSYLRPPPAFQYTIRETEAEGERGRDGRGRDGGMEGLMEGEGEGEGALLP